MNCKKLLDYMWDDYLKLNPIAEKVYELFANEGEEVINDHIALRTFNHPKVTIDVIAKVFKEGGYVEKDTYHFEKKKLFAKHFEHADPALPKVFISELLIEKMSAPVQEKIMSFMNQLDGDTVHEFHFLLSGRHWDVSLAEYEELLKESEYAAWMAAFGFRPNHFTVNVNHLKKFDEIEDINEFLKKNQITLNDSGGEVKGSEQDFLKQSSTKANSVLVKFSDGEKEIPSCYYEFAKRFPMENGELYQGFVAKSADKIFESTDTLKN